MDTQETSSDSSEEEEVTLPSVSPESYCLKAVCAAPVRSRPSQKTAERVGRERKCASQTQENKEICELQGSGMSVERPVEMDVVNHVVQCDEYYAEIGIRKTVEDCCWQTS